MLRTIGRRLKSQIPHPPLASSGLGHIPLIQQYKTINEFIQNQFTELNSDIFSFKLGEVKNVVLGHPKYLKAVSRFTNKSPQGIQPYIPVLGENSIILANQPEHDRMKSYFYGIFSMQNIRHYHYNSIARVLRQWAIPTVENSINQPNPVVGSDLGLGISFRVIIQTTFGVDIIENIQECDECIEQILGLWEVFSTALIAGPIAEGSERDLLMKSANKKFKQLAQDSISRLNKGQEATVFAQQLFNGQSLEEINDQLKTLIVAGTHTTGYLLNWIFYFLAKYPETQAKLHQELDRLGDFDVLDYNRFKEMAYTRNLIDETLRYTYYLWVLFRWNDGQDIELPGGYMIENGDSIWISQKAMFYNTDYWENPDQFNPDRFLKPQSRGLHFQPFGFQGGRVCPGSNLANVEVHLALASIFKRFKVELDQNQKEIEMVVKVNTVPTEDILLRFSERQVVKI